MHTPMVLSHASVQSSSNVAGTITLVGVAEKRHFVPHLVWSYSGTPIAGRITSTGLDGDEMDIDVIIGGPGALKLAPACGLPNTDVSFTIAAGGAGIVGKLWLAYFTSYGWGK